jgi:large subunit ribosomal protein L4
MAEAPVLGGASRSVELNADAFGARFNGPLVHESVRAEFAARRRGSASTKTRGLVSGGGAKPWRQKGTGRARAGSSRSPVWTGGGTVFGPHPRSYTFKVNRKERRAALRSALSLHADRGSLAVLDAANLVEPSTRVAARLLDAWGQPRATLVVVTAEERGAALSFRNIDRVSVLQPSSVGVADIVGAASLLCSDAALAELTARAAGDAGAAGDAADATPSSPAERAGVEPSRAASVPATPAAAASAAPSSRAEPAPAQRSRAGSAAAAKADPPTAKAPAKPKGTTGAAAGAASSSSAQKAPASRSRAAAKPAGESKASAKPLAESKASAKPAAAATKPKATKPKPAPRGNTTAATRAPAKARQPGCGDADGVTTED